MSRSAARASGHLLALAGPVVMQKRVSLPPADPAARQHVSRGLAWIGLGSALIGALDLAAQMIILHFFLGPAEYGVAALVTTLFPFLDQATNMGMSSAVIQRDDHDPDAIAAVFWMNCLMSAA